MSLPWGVKEAVDPANADAVKTFVTSLSEQSFSMPSGNEIKVLKADVKERKGAYLMIMRYQITTQA